jgi:hypothetical protein
VSELERDLRALAREVELPEMPDLVPGVRRALEQTARRRPAWLSRRPVAVAVAVSALAVAAALAVPPARSALADLFRIGGAEIERVDTLPQTQPNARLAPGRPLALDEARERAGFRIRTPARCAHCDSVLYDDTIPGGRVTIVWPGRRPRLFLMQFRGEAIPYVAKLATPRTALRSVSVDEMAGYWVAGSPHAVVFKDARGRTLFGRRLAGNVLLWERDGITFRLEGDVPLRQALAIAESLE